ncbi:helix-turn-helix domain-containing protein [Streptomyces sp. NBC_00470]|uniref:MmyB family transcriptional regulator n=1 Tax=Streptomyces sp. NBC_00470 TaxID=2975753 RepID=UPI0030E43742
MGTVPQPREQTHWGADAHRMVASSEAAASVATEMNASRLRALLQGRRERLALGQEAIAERLGISPRAYGNWERGRVKEWTDEKLYALAGALEMSEFQTNLLFLYAVDREAHADMSPISSRHEAHPDGTSAFLSDYDVMMEALSLPAFVIDTQWNVKMANKAYRDLFANIKPHPTASPTANFLRFGLFHPEASTVLVDQQSWQLAMLTQLSSSLDRHDADTGLHAIRRDVYMHPALHKAYREDMPQWIMGSGADLVYHESAIRELRHPDPHIGLRGCRVVEETPRRLKSLGLTRLTLVLTDLEDERMADQGDRHGAHDHHAP